MWQQKAFSKLKRNVIFSTDSNWKFRRYDISCNPHFKRSRCYCAEDTRQTKKLCNYFEIETPVMSYHEHNKEVSGRKILDKLEEGKTVAIVSDAGMPCISDPGYDIVVEAVAEQYHVIPLPGANAALQH